MGMIDGLTKVIEIEEKLAAGASVDEIEALLPSPFGGKALGGAKDTDDFKFLTYAAVPKWTNHRSLMSKVLSPELFDSLKDAKTSAGYTLSNAIQTGVETPHLGVGATAGDEECYEVFKDLYYPIIKGWHGYDAETSTHPTDLDPEKLVFSEEQVSKFDQYVVSTRVRAARNIRGHPLPAGATHESLKSVEDLLQKTFAGLDGELKGTYYPLGGLSADEESSLQESGFLFQKPGGGTLLTNAGAARYWPDGRGIFHNDDKTALCWCNEEDHCRIISMQNGGNVKAVFARFCALSDAMKSSAEAAGAALMHNDKLGFIGTCPSNLGTGLRASCMIKLPKLNENVQLLERVCAAFDLQPRGSSGEHSAAIGAKWDVSNKQRIGFSGVQLVQKMIDGLTKVIEIEEKLAAGASVEEIEGLLPSPFGGKALGDAKDTDDFKFLTYAAVPKWTNHRSLMSKVLSPELFDSLKDAKTSAGYTLSNAIQTGVETPHLGVGATAGDEECYEVFKDLYYPIIKGWHGYDAETSIHPTDLDPEKLVFSEEQVSKFDQYVVSTRVRAARNIRGHPLPAGATHDSLKSVEDLLQKTFAGLDGELKGTYYPLGGLSADEESSLQESGFLFQKPGGGALLTNAGAARYWPDGRGIFHNDDKTALCWCNEEDHCRIISMQNGGNV